MFEYFREQLHVIGGIAKTTPLSCSCINSRHVAYISNCAPGDLKCRNNHADEVAWTLNKPKNDKFGKNVSCRPWRGSRVSYCWFVRCYLKPVLVETAPVYCPSCYSHPHVPSALNSSTTCLVARLIYLETCCDIDRFSRDLIVLLQGYWDFSRVPLVFA